MKAYEIKMFRDRLLYDPGNETMRRTFHEYYEWLKAYWNENYKSNPISKFCKDFENYFWGLDPIKEVARKLSFYAPVGSSSFNFEPTSQIQQATFF